MESNVPCLGDDLDTFDGRKIDCPPHGVTSEQAPKAAGKEKKTELGPKPGSVENNQMKGVEMTTEERLVKLEKELAGAKRRSRVMLVAAVLSVAAVFLLGAGNDAAQRVVRAGKFELVDSTGKTRAVLAVSPSGQAHLVLKDENGLDRVGMSASASGPSGVHVYGEAGHLRARLSVDEADQSGLYLSDPNGTDCVNLVLPLKGPLGLNLVGRGDSLRASLALDATGRPTLRMPGGSVDLKQ